MSINKTMSVSESVAIQALAAVESHPMRAEAAQWTHCVHDVFSMPKAFIDRAPFLEEEKGQLHTSLANEESIIVVSYYTSSKKPEPLGGEGKHYVFLLNPTTLEVLKSSIGTWRS